MSGNQGIEGIDWKALAAPFGDDDVEWRIGHVAESAGRALVLPYVTNRAIMDRLDAVAGHDDWRNEYLPWREKGVLCGLSIRVAGEWVTKWDGADQTDIEPTKGGLSDSMKRAAVQWGMGRELYRLPALWWDGIEKRGRSWAITRKPTLADAMKGQEAPRQQPSASQSPPAREQGPGYAAERGDTPNCPVCQGPMWDNRADRKKDEEAYAAGTRKGKPRPAWKCKDKACTGTIWPSDPNEADRPKGAATGAPARPALAACKRSLRAAMMGLGFDDAQQKKVVANLASNQYGAATLDALTDAQCDEVLDAVREHRLDWDACGIVPQAQDDELPF